MKKTLLISGLLLSSYFTVNAQVLEAENFNSLNVGNVNTNFTGTAAGQGGLFTLASAGGTNDANTNFQIVTDAAAGRTKVLQITGSNTSTGTRIVTKLGFDTLWANRTPDNEVLQQEFSFFTGPATTSNSELRPVVFGMDTNVIGGFSFNVGSKILQGFAWGDFNNTGTSGQYVIGLKTGGLVLPANTWVTVGFAYDSIDGIFTWLVKDGINAPVTRTLTGSGGYEPKEFDILYYAAPFQGTNSVASTIKIDDYTISATPTINLLSVGKFANENNFSVYPNPVSDFVNVQSGTNAIEKVSVTDLNGRTVKTISTSGTEARINISDLASGVYMLNINSDNGSVTKKIVKK